MATLALERITQERSIEQRVGGLQAARVREYRTAMKNGATFPPVVVFHDQEHDTYWLADGFHRCVAAQHAGLTEIEAEVHVGTRRDAVLYAVGANTGHGIRRTNADKRHAVLTLLADEEWGHKSAHEIARQTHTTQPFVSKLLRRVHTGTLRIGADGGVMNTAQIGKARAGGLITGWKRATAQERAQWIRDHRQEIEALLRQYPSDAESSRGDN